MQCTIFVETLNNQGFLDKPSYYACFHHVNSIFLDYILIKVLKIPNYYYLFPILTILTILSNWNVFSLTLLINKDMLIITI